ncbi:MAG: aldose 1-epimerase family protein [Bacteroidales bacterium]|nr:aldose 1-epimerase family protein [Candidatus Liminaster caballi]
MKTITNGTLTIAVKEHGAELASIRCNGREYLWQADESFWKRHSPVLFPIVGSLWNGECRSHGQTFKMGQHGFARDMEFSLISATDTELRYELRSSAETLTRYPYQFRLEIGYRLEGNRVKVLWHVENTGNERMAFQIGAHPAFHWPLLTDAQIEQGVTAMRQPLEDTDSRGWFHIVSTDRVLPLSVVTEKGCIGAESSVSLDQDGYLPLSLDTFAHDALIVEDSRISKVTICREDKTPYLSLEFKAPLVGLWSPPGKRAPFVCIEPWYGRADKAHYDGTYEYKPWMQMLEKGCSFDASYDIIIEQ